MIAQSVANILRDHVKLSVEGIDRMCLNVYVPRLQSEQGIVWFFRHHRGQPIPSAALMGPMTRSFVAALEDFAARRGVPLEQFRKGQREDDVMAEHLRQFSSNEGVVFIGKAQEKTSVFRTEKRRNPKTGAPLSMDREIHRDGQPNRDSCAPLHRTSDTEFESFLLA